MRPFLFHTRRLPGHLQAHLDQIHIKKQELKRKPLPELPVSFPDEFSVTIQFDPVLQQK
jgi:hypothetical protein